VPFRDWLIDAFAPELRVSEADTPVSALREAHGATIDADEDQWRPITGDARRDLAPITQSRMQKMAAYLWEANLLANRLIELPIAYLLGEGVQLQVLDADAQLAIDRFWRDPINQMDLKLPKKVRELALFGEQCWPAFVNELNGHVRLGYLDPALIERVAVDPDNPEQPIGIETVQDALGRSRKYRVIINGPEEVFTRRTQAIRRAFADGECFFFRVNDLSSGRRGRSDLLAQADWLDTYEQFLFGEADRAVSLRSFIWDVTLTGASPEQVEARAKRIAAPKPGSVRVHNDAEQWQALAPELGAGDLSEIAKLFRQQMLGGATMPPHWFGDPGDVNRATGQEMSDATVKILTQRQRYWGHILVFLAQYVIRQRWLRTDKGEPDFETQELQVSVQFPEIQARDTTKYAAALQQVTAAVVIAIDRGLITEELGLRTIAVVAERLGVQFDAAHEIVAARAQRAQRRVEELDDTAFRDLPGESGEEEPPNFEKE
jgi:hypothetical protein